MSASALLAGCAGNGGRTALAISDVRWHGATALVVSTECSTDLEAEVGGRGRGSGPIEVTLWGEPDMGRCRSKTKVEVPAGTTRIVDGTTSLVVDLPPGPT